MKFKSILSTGEKTNAVYKEICVHHWMEVKREDTSACLGERCDYYQKPHSHVEITRHGVLAMCIDCGLQRKLWEDGEIEERKEDKWNKTN